MVPTVFDVAVSPTNKDVVLAVTGSDTRVPLESKAGIYRSSDGGTSWTLVHQFRYNQETCKADLDKKFPALPVGQVVFARDDSNLVYAAGGCAIAKSIDGGVTWVDKPIPGSQERARAWHVVTAPQEGPIRRVYAAGDGKIFYSKDGGIPGSQIRPLLSLRWDRFREYHMEALEVFQVVAAIAPRSSPWSRDIQITFM